MTIHEKGWTNVVDLVFINRCESTVWTPKSVNEEGKKSEGGWNQCNGYEERRWMGWLRNLQGKRRDGTHLHIPQRYSFSSREIIANKGL